VAIAMENSGNGRPADPANCAIEPKWVSFPNPEIRKISAMSAREMREIDLFMALTP
jgi:hypothetical protein